MFQVLGSNLTHKNFYCIKRLIESENRSLLIQIFTDCMVRTNSQVESEVEQGKSNNYRNCMQSWLIEFVGLIKKLADPKDFNSLNVLLIFDIFLNIVFF